jgi:hypothetical protein
VISTLDSDKKVRYRDYPITPEVLQGIITRGWRANIECTDGLPPNAKFIYAYVSYGPVLIHLIFEHHSFDEISLMETPPMGSACFSQHYEPQLSWPVTEPSQELIEDMRPLSNLISEQVTRALQEGLQR